MQQPPQERAAYLERACAGEPALRQRVEALLGAHAAAGSFLQPTAVRPCPTAEGPPVGERPGASVGPYKLLELLGQGGMGEVWLAQQQEPVKRLVALKLIRAGLDSAQVIARF